MTLLPYVISSRVRLARNIKQYRFPHTASTEERDAVFTRLCQVIRTEPCFEHTELFPLDTLSPLERKMLEEQNIISHTSTLCNPHHSPGQAMSRLVILQKTTKTSILVNEEDHLRIQACLPGFQIQEAWKRASRLENSLEQQLDFAYSEHYGYLTTCPRNTGLGMRASVMLFLPGLIMLKRIKPLIESCISKGFTLRGRYGEGSESQGYVLQLSLQRPQERNASRILDDLQRACQHIIIQEKRARRFLRNHEAQSLQQQFKQTTHTVITTQDLDVATSMHIVAMYRLGIALGLLSLSSRERHPLRILNGIQRRTQRYRDLQQIDLLAIQIQPAHIYQYALRHSQRMTAVGIRRANENSEHIRANYLRQELGTKLV